MYLISKRMKCVTYTHSHNEKSDYNKFSFRVNSCVLNVNDNPFTLHSSPVPPATITLITMTVQGLQYLFFLPLFIAMITPNEYLDKINENSANILLLAQSSK